jgi:hypothetical protein
MTELLIVLVGLFVAGWCAYWFAHDVKVRALRWRYEQVCAGMTENDVIAMIGAPEVSTESEPDKSSMWTTPWGEYALLVDFDATGRAASVQRITRPRKRRRSWYGFG